MKRILLSVCLGSLTASLAFSQGLVVCHSIPPNQISTNSIPGGPATGLTSGAPGIYYYALFASPANSSINDNTNAILGYSSNYVFDNPTGWILVGLGANLAIPGRMAAISQGTNSANQGPLNADGSLSVTSIGAGQYAYFVVLGWSADGAGTNVDELAAAYHNGTYTGWIGQSAVSGAIQLGDGVQYPTPNVFSALAPPYIPGFVLGMLPEVETPVISQQPASVNVCVGSNATLNVVAAGSPTLTYAWYSGTNLVSSGMNSSCQINQATTNDAGDYWVVVANSFGSVTSDVAMVAVGFPPCISQQPASQTVPVGTTVALPVVASGTGPLSYQWYNSSGAMADATNASLSFMPAQTNLWDTYQVTVANGFGTVTSLLATLIVYQPVTLLSQPISRVVANHGTATFAVNASGFPAPIYQWSLDSTNLMNATNSSLIINPVQLRNLGSYCVTVGNGFSTTNSFSAGLYMFPSIDQPFTGTVGIWGQPTTLQVGAIGSEPLTYQWFLDGIAVAQATNADYVLPALQFTNAGLYSVVVTSPFGSATNATYQLVVNPAGVNIAMRPSLTINGAAGYSYIIQGTFSLADTNTWITLTNLTLSQPIQIWHDDGADPTDPVNPTRYYRVLPGQ
jgi:hypothetical protein